MVLLGVLLGVALRALLASDDDATRRAGEAVASAAHAGLALFARALHLVVQLIPFAVLGVVAKVVSRTGVDVFRMLLPFLGTVLLGLNRLTRIIEVDGPNRVAHVEPGVVNARLSRMVAPLGLHYAPDPSSQTVCTIGGNAAANAGGPRCPKYGVTHTNVAVSFPNPPLPNRVLNITICSYSHDILITSNCVNINIQFWNIANFLNKNAY